MFSNKKLRIIILLLVTLVVIFAFYRNYKHTASNALDASVDELLVIHANQYQSKEYFSGMSLTIAIPDDKIRNYYYGKISHEQNAPKVNSETLFEIGSITKSFTSALVLQLEKEEQLSLLDPVGKYVKKYKKWDDVEIQRLLNMTGGLPNYTNVPEFVFTIFSKPGTMWSTDQLINYAYPSSELTPPMKTGFYYSNTGYLIAGKIVELASHKKLDEMYRDRIFNQANLLNTYYFPIKIEADVYSRLARGYSYDPYAFPSMVGRDMTNDNMTSSGADGSIIASTEDIVKWIRAIFIEETILDRQQKTKLTTLVSTLTGKPIQDVSKSDPTGFGLGVLKHYNEKYPKESMWTYEGRMFGFRAIYFYMPCNNIIISAAFNSATDDENDHSEELLNNAYDIIIKNNPKLRC